MTRRSVPGAMAAQRAAPRACSALLLAACCLLFDTADKASGFAAPPGQSGRAWVRGHSAAAVSTPAPPRKVALGTRRADCLLLPAALAALAAAGRRQRVLRAAEGEAAVVETQGNDVALQATLFVGYFFAQSSMSFFMKWVLAAAKSPGGLVGIPAPFLVTSCQQFTGFCLVLAFMAGSRLFGKGYTPKKLASAKEYMLVLLLSTSFSLNIGLNLLSLALLPLSLTFIIRSCMPLSTAIVQTLIQRKTQDIALGEWLCMILGVLCAVVVVIAQSGGPTGSANPMFFIGVATAVASICCGALDFVYKSVLGTSVKLSAVDTIFYMALPVVVLTALIGIIPKPMSLSWAAKFGPYLSDWGVFGKLWAGNPTILAWVFASGAFAFAYNVFVTFTVVKLSPATTSFAGNFNKAATVLISLLFLEGKLPPGYRGVMLVTGVVLNLFAFAAYNTLKMRRKNNGK